MKFLKYHVLLMSAPPLPRNFVISLLSPIPSMQFPVFHPDVFMTSKLEGHPCKTHVEHADVIFPDEEE